MAVKQKSKDEMKSEGIKRVLEEGAARRKGLRGLNKKTTTYHGKTTSSEEQREYIDPNAGPDGAGAVELGPMAPNEQQLALVNQYTRSPKTAADVVVFPTMSCNTLPDRDDDFFDRETVQGFAELPTPYGPNGKSYMVGHNYNLLPTGRIFDTNTADQGSVLFLRNQVYIPNTDQYQAFIEDIDFGINWAVSVGVLLEAQLCSICNANQWSCWGFAVCDTGHIKGSMYNKDETRTDDWGFIIEAVDGDATAVKAMGVMHGAVDFYELSQVFLGAQFFAELDQPEPADAEKSAARKSFQQAVKGGRLFSRNVPILGLSEKEAGALPIPHSDSKVADALNKYPVERSKDGSMRWTDSDGLIWNYEPGSSVLCLGKAVEDANENENEKEANDDGTNGRRKEADGTAAGSGEVGVGSGEQGSDSGGTGDLSEGLQDPGQSGDPEGDLGSDRNLTAAGSADNTRGDQVNMDKAAVLAACKQAGLPDKFLSVITEADGDGLLAVFRAASTSITEMSEQITDLTPKAAMGDAYMQTLRADVIASYVKSKAGEHPNGVDTSQIEKLLDAVGPNEELLLGMAADYSGQARAKLPGVRRTTFEDADVNERGEIKTPQTPPAGGLSRKGSATVTRIHG